MSKSNLIIYKAWRSRVRSRGEILSRSSSSSSSFVSSSTFVSRWKDDIQQQQQQKEQQLQVLNDNNTVGSGECYNWSSFVLALPPSHRCLMSYNGTAASSMIHFSRVEKRLFSSSSSSKAETTTTTIDSSSHEDVSVTKSFSSMIEPDVSFPKAVVSKRDVEIVEKTRRRMSEVLISEVLKAKHTFRWVDPVISRNATVKDAIQAVIDGGLSGMMVLDTVNPNDPERSQKKVVGLLTSRDLLRIMASGIKEGASNDNIMEQRIVGDFMTPISQVIYARPDETVGMCRTIMAKLGIKCLPVLSRQGQVEGLITARDMSDFGLSAKDKGGKQAYLNDISERVGLSSNTSMADPPNFLKAHLALEKNPVFLNVGVAALPHPFKTAKASGRSLKEIGQTKYSSDPSLSEDSHFCTTVYFPDEKDRKLTSYTYMGVADGVGSWREYGVDPREFPRALMAECENILVERTHSNTQPTEKYTTFSSLFRSTGVERQKSHSVISPAEVMSQAYERVKADNIIGSTTACIALFDGIRHQLHFSNLGDSGIIVLRHIDSDVAGSLKRDSKPRLERLSDLRVTFVSQQQLRSFNHPYQLGWTGEELAEGASSSFRLPKDACTTSIHIRRGDIVIIATDGLFDNVEGDEIAAMCLDWEQTNGFIRGGDVIARERRWAMGNSLARLSMERIGDLAQALCMKARENSVNKEIDSPFAVLAKENDIMWSGGMPDDCTVLALHVTGRDANDVMDKTQQ